MIFGSVCSGIGAPEMAWQPLGWESSFVSEIDKFPRAVLEHRFGAGSDNGPQLFGDFTAIQETDIARPIDILVGGTPCQSFSIAGLRGGLGDDRGNLALEFLRLAQRLRPRWLVWENVPGVLSSNGGRDFGSILGGMAECGYGFAYRILDAQHVRVESHARAVPQRRRRVFVVGYLGDWRRAAAVLFERESLQRHPAPRREAGEDVAGTLISRASGGGGGPGAGTDEAAAGYLQPVGRTRGQDPVVACAPVANTLNAHFGDKMGLENEHINAGAPLFVAHASVAVAIQERAVSENPDTGPDGAGVREDGAAYTLEARTVPQSVGYSIMPMNSGKDYKARETDVAQPVMAGGPVGGNQGGDFVAEQWAVRRLTPTECARLQGFPDDHARIPWRGKPAEKCPDGPQYKAYGNSMAVPVMSWIGQRIEMVDAIPSTQSQPDSQPHTAFQEGGSE